MNVCAFVELDLQLYKIIEPTFTQSPLLGLSVSCSNGNIKLRFNTSYKNMNIYVKPIEMSYMDRQTNSN
jgi:hypothetical protein